MLKLAAGFEIVTADLIKPRYVHLNFRPPWLLPPKLSVSSKFVSIGGRWFWDRHRRLDYYHEKSFCFKLRSPVMVFKAVGFEIITAAMSGRTKSELKNLEQSLKPDFF